MNTLAILAAQAGHQHAARPALEPRLDHRARRAVRRDGDAVRVPGRAAAHHPAHAVQDKDGRFVGLAHFITLHRRRARCAPPGTR